MGDAAVGLAPAQLEQVAEEERAATAQWLANLTLVPSPKPAADAKGAAGAAKDASASRG